MFSLKVHKYRPRIQGNRKEGSQGKAEKLRQNDRKPRKQKNNESEITKKRITEY